MIPAYSLIFESCILLALQQLYIELDFNAGDLCWKECNHKKKRDGKTPNLSCPIGE